MQDTNRRTRQIKDSYSGIIWNKIIIIRWSSPHSMAESKASEGNERTVCQLPTALLFTVSEIEHYQVQAKGLFQLCVQMWERCAFYYSFFLFFLFWLCYFDFAQCNIYRAKMGNWSSVWEWEWRLRCRKWKVNVPSTSLLLSYKIPHNQ